MRLRNIPGAEQEVLDCPYTVKDTGTCKGRWSEIFNNNNPIYIEIGMGKGRFIINNALEYPDINFIGIEKYPSVQIRAVQKLKEMEDIPNLRLLSVNAEILPEIFAEEEIGRIYLNFSDPWPKDRHSKRRLTSKEFLGRYRQILKPGGLIEFKTDNKKLYDFSLSEIEEAGWVLDAKTENLHKDPVMAEGNIMTEYEVKFIKLDKHINKMIFHYENAR